ARSTPTRTKPRVGDPGSQARCARLTRRYIGPTETGWLQGISVACLPPREPSCRGGFQLGRWSTSVVNKRLTRTIQRSLCSSVINGLPFWSSEDALVKPLSVKIVIADEQLIFRDGLRRLLETLPRLKIVGESSGDEQTAA